MAKEKAEKKAIAEGSETAENSAEQTEKKAVVHEVKEAKEQENKPVEEKPVFVERPKKKKKPKKERPVWVEYKPAEIVEMIVSLANQGQTASEIGTTLKEQHGVLDVKQATKKTILDILIEAGLKPSYPEDLLALIKKSVALDAHLKKNKKDASAKRGYELSVSKIRRLTKYYIRKKRLPSNWRYDIETARLLVK